MSIHTTPAPPAYQPELLETVAVARSAIRDIARWPDALERKQALDDVGQVFGAALANAYEEARIAHAITCED